MPESTIELTCEDRIQEYQCGTELDGITPIMCQDVYTSLLSDDFYAYWSQHPDFKYYPFIEYTESFPFVYPAGQLTFTMD